MRRMLVAIVPGEGHERVVDAAAELAADLEAEVTVVAIDDVQSQRFEQLPRKEHLARAEAAATGASDRLAERGVAATARAISGAGAAAVEAVARDVEADIIVVGSGDRPSLAKRLLGDLALELVRSSQRQVLVIAER